MRKFVFTCGDINGIGPEICVKTFNKIFNPKKYGILFVCPANVFEVIIRKIKPEFKYSIIKNLKEFKPDRVNVLDLGKANFTPGKPTKVSGRIAYKAINQALKSIDEGYAGALITAPISKHAVGLAGLDFPGHTELLASRYKVKNFSMMFLSSSMKVGLVTIHEPLKKVPHLITAKNLVNTIETVGKSLESDFGIAEPELAVLGLNPHAGEKGRIGKEEMQTIKPVIRKFKNVYGPFVPDAFFGEKLYKNFDAVIGMYHDQVLIPFKLLNFRKGVNFTAGLPFVRTSPDHGTAFDIAGKFIADETSMIEAFKWADKILKYRKRNAAE